MNFQEPLNDRQNPFKKPIHDGVLRVLNENTTKSEHVIDLKNEKNILKIPHIDRATLEKKFKIIKDDTEIKPDKQDCIKEENSCLIPIYKPKNIWQKFLESGKLLATAGVIFLVLFTALNFQSFSQIAEKRFFPERIASKQVALENALNKNLKAQLLPTAGMKREYRKQFMPLNIKAAPLENRIIIPKIGKNIIIVGIPNNSLLEEDWKALEDDIQEGLKNGVVHYPGTAIPGQYGNVFITGHSSYYPWDDGKYKDVFALLHDLEVGDEYTIYWNQIKYDYKIIEKEVVSPKDTSALDQPQNQKISTLMTCTPVGTAKNRLIIKAEQVN